MQHDWLEKDFYKILGVKNDVNDKELSKAYRKLARKYHPDANPNDVSAEERFKEVSEAYDVLSDDGRRREYDQLRKYGASGGNPFGGRGGGPAPGAGGFNFNPGDLSDLLGDLLGNSRRTGPGTGPKRGDDLEAKLKLNFDDALNGITTTVHLTSDAACSTCSGTGSAPGTTPDICPQCSGRGVLDDNQGLFSLSQPCPRCSGRGRVVTNPCSNCQSSGVERKPRQVKVRIPSGVKDGQRIKLKGRGAPGRNGGPAGDLFVIVNVGAHTLFGRTGNNLTIDIPITFSEATLGANVKVPTFDGPNVTLKVPSGTPSGKTFRVKGKGVATSTKTGDLLVTVVVDVPSELTDEQRTALEALAAIETSPREQAAGAS